MTQRCEIIWFTVSYGVPFAFDYTNKVITSEPHRAVARCMTHQWSDVHGVAQDLPGHSLCPLGRIEEATELALEKIREAQK